MESKFYLDNGDGYIGLIYVADISSNDKWQAIAHYLNFRSCRFGCNCLTNLWFSRIPGPKVAFAP